MNKKIPILIVVFIFVIIGGILIGRNFVEPKKGTNPTTVQPKSSTKASPSTIISSKGSVDTPNCDGGVVVTGTNSALVCGVATLTGNSSNANIKGVPSPKEGDFISKTITLYFTSGSAQLCFASANGTGVIYYRPLGITTWTSLPTKLSDGLACIVVSSDGSYALGNQ